LLNSIYHLQEIRIRFLLFHFFHDLYQQNVLSGKKGFDAILIDDFLYNHYPEIRPLWNNMFEYNSKVVEKRHTLARLIDERLRTLLRTDTYRYLDEPGKYYHLDYNEFDL
jgi:hypothetical protein